MCPQGQQRKWQGSISQSGVGFHDRHDTAQGTGQEGGMVPEGSEKDTHLTQPHKARAKKCKVGTAQSPSHECECSLVEMKLQLNSQ